MNVRDVCLAILSMGDASGYEIKKMFEGPFSHLFEASYGSIYPALGKLTAAGLVTCEARAQQKRPDKKVYSLTQDGRLALTEALAITPGPDRVRSEFLLIMLFAHVLAPAQVSNAIEARLVFYRSMLDELRAGRLEGGEGALGDVNSAAFVRGYGAAMIEASLAYIEEHRHLVESASLLGKADAAE